MDLIQTIDNLLNPDVKIRSAAELAISNLADADFKEYLQHMCKVLANEGIQQKIRKMVATLIKNPIAYLPKFNDKWKSFDNEFKDQIKQLILATLGSDTSEIRKAGAAIIATIIKTELPITEKWSSLLPILCNSNFDNKSFYLSAIETLGFICEELNKKEVSSNEVDQILSAIVMCIKNNLNEISMIIGSLKALIRALPLIGHMKMSLKQYADILMNEIFQIGQIYQSNESVLELICKIFIEIAEHYYDTFELYHENVASFTFVIIGSNSERLRILGLEFWCRLGTEELERHKNSKKNVPCRFYFQAYFIKLKEIIEYLILGKQNEDEEEWNSSKASSFILSILVQVIDEKKFDEIAALIRETMKSDDLKTLKKSIIILSCAMESIAHKAVSFQLGLQYMYKISNYISYKEDYDIKLISSRALIMITKVMGKYLEPTNLRSLVPLLKNNIYVDNKLGINVCLTLINIITSIGDLSTNKSQNHFSSFFEDLIQVLIKCDENINYFERDSNLSIYCFLTIENLISYSSHDKQPKLLEILASFVMKLKNINTKTFPYNILHDLESHYARMIRIILIKLVTPLSFEDAKGVYNIIVESFKRRNIYDEGLLAISSLALSKYNI